MPSFEDALEAKARVFGRVLGPGIELMAGNFTGLGMGVKRGSFCLRVYVRRKLPRRDLGESYLPRFLKSLIDDFPIEVVETGELIAHTGAARGTTSLRIGAPVKLAGAASQGRVGAFVEAEGHLHLLSCSHVLDGRGRLGQAVFSGDQLVGHLSGQELLQPERPGSEPREDCARARLAEGVTPSFELPEPLGRLKRPIPAPGEVGMMVWKVGEKVESGVIVDRNADMRVHYPSLITVLRNQLLIYKPGGHFSNPGDSGAMVVAAQGAQCEAVGMVVGANPRAAEWTLATPMDRVLTSLGSQLVVG